MNEAIWFFSKSDHAWLSNFSAHSILMDQVTWPTVEHFYQGQKHRGTKLSEQIRLAGTPALAKQMGYDFSSVQRADWLDVRDTVMREALMAKFHQHARLGQWLLETQDRELIHQSDSDVYWGRRRLEGVGANRLGEEIMRIRYQLSQQLDGT